MSIDTWLIVPASRAEARQLLRLNPELDAETTQLGKDFIALYQTEGFQLIRADPEHWGPTYAAALPPSARKRLDPRGLLVVPEIGQDLRGRRYAELWSQGIWLPAKKQRMPARKRRLLLMALSEPFQKVLLNGPELVADLVAKPDPRALTLDADERWGPLIPQKGIPHYEDKDVETSLPPSESPSPRSFPPRLQAAARARTTASGRKSGRFKAEVTASSSTR